MTDSLGQKAVAQLAWAEEINERNDAMRLATWLRQFMTHSRLLSPIELDQLETARITLNAYRNALHDNELFELWRQKCSEEQLLIIRLEADNSFLRLAMAELEAENARLRRDVQPRPHKFTLVDIVERAAEACMAAIGREVLKGPQGWAFGKDPQKLISEAIVRALREAGTLDPIDD